MIIEDHVRFDTAKLLKEKGFDETCRAFWKEWNGELHLCDCSSRHVFEFCRNSMLEGYNDKEETNIAAPTLQMAMKWLREVHSIDISIDIRFWTDDEGVDVKSWRYTVYRTDEIEDFGQSDTYEEAAEAAIKSALENLI